ncbi:MAG: helix-turn-helix transcriptional regulator [Candidatus Aminicenantes bacterium]|nr:MAG: helix-turn-helix transcriptional regulator [Candidatus Aminicenantes bacterium]
MNKKPVKTNSCIAILDRVTEFIITRDTMEFSELTVEKICRQLNISQSNLYYSFLKRGPMTPGQFLLGVKLGRAVMFLKKDNRLTVKKISEKVGFNTLDYFIKVFKGYFGTTPGKYRKKICVGKQETR